jgi:hypothetical protein
MSEIEDRVSRLRGSIEAAEPGARGIERVARNPDCLRLRAVTIAGMTPAQALKVMGRPDREGQSPFAMLLGQQFERFLLRNGAANLFAVYRKENILTQAEAKIVSVEDLAPGTSIAARRRRESETRRLLDLKLKGDPLAPNLIIKPRLPVSLVGIPHPIEPDFLIAADSDRFYRVGELKSYPDRGGKTDPADLRSACRQAAVGTVGLRQWLTAKGVQSSELVALAKADLVLRVTGFFLPTLNRQDIEGEVDSVFRALADAPANLDELELLLPPGASLDNPTLLEAVPNNYRPSCKEHCAMWEHCRARAQANSHPIILGDYAAEKLAAAASLSRALELMNGTGIPPRNAAEAALAAELRAGDAAFKKAVGHV